MSKSSKNAQNGSTELIDYLRTNNIKLPKFSELANPLTIPQSVVEKLKAIEKNTANPINLYRVHWYNDEEGLGFDEIPGFIEIPKAISGTNASIVVMLGERFPMVSAHKVWLHILVWFPVSWKDPLILCIIGRFGRQQEIIAAEALLYPKFWVAEALRSFLKG